MHDSNLKTDSTHGFTSKLLLPAVGIDCHGRKKMRGSAVEVDVWSVHLYLEGEW